MTTRIVQRISLEGDQDVKVRLDAMGQAGEAAFARIGQAAKGVGDIGAGVASGVSRLGQTIGQLRSVELAIEGISKATIGAAGNVASGVGTMVSAFGRVSLG